MLPGAILLVGEVTESTAMTGNIRSRVCIARDNSNVF